jgi:hypothetical protein
LNFRQRMTFQNGKRMVHPRRIHYEQGVLNQSFLFTDNQNTGRETIYYVSQPLNQETYLNGAYLHLTMRFMDNNWQYLTNMQKGFSVDWEEKTIIPENPGVYVVIMEAKRAKGEILGKMELQNELIYDSVIVINSHKPKEHKVFLLGIGEAEKLKIGFSISDSQSEAEVTVLMIKISDI